MGTDLYSCIVREAYRALTLDVALLYLDGDIPELPHPMFPAEPTFAFWLVLDLIKYSEDGWRNRDLERSPLARTVAALPHPAAAYYQPEVTQYNGDDMDDFVLRFAPTVIGAVRIIGDANVPMSNAEWRRAFDIGAPFMAPNPLKRPKSLTLEKLWDRAFGALPRARYEIELRDVSWLNKLRTNTWFTSRADAVHRHADTTAPATEQKGTEPRGESGKSSSRKA